MKKTTKTNKEKPIREGKEMHLKVAIVPSAEIIENAVILDFDVLKEEHAIALEFAMKFLVDLGCGIYTTEENYKKMQDRFQDMNNGDNN